MKYTSYSYPSGRAEVAAFVVTGGVTEYHVMIHATDPKQTYREQMNVVLDAYAALLKKELSGAVYFCPWFRHKCRMKSMAFGNGTDRHLK